MSPSSTSIMSTLSSHLPRVDECTHIKVARGNVLVPVSDHTPLERIDRKVQREESDADEERNKNARLLGVLSDQEHPA